MPFSFNPFSKKKIDFTKSIPKAPKEIDPQRPLSGKTDDDIIRNQQSPEVRTEKTIIREQAAKDDDLPPPIP